VGFELPGGGLQPSQGNVAHLHDSGLIGSLAPNLRENT
jgi:hypothetical protein